MLLRMQGKRHTHSLLVGVQACIATTEVNVAAPQEAGNRCLSRTSHIPKGHFILLQRRLLIHVHMCYIYNS